MILASTARIGEYTAKCTCGRYRSKAGGTFEISKAFGDHAFAKRHDKW